jgi:hypothetical protein
MQFTDTLDLQPNATFLASPLDRALYEILGDYAAGNDTKATVLARIKGAIAKHTPEADTAELEWLRRRRDTSTEQFSKLEAALERYKMYRPQPWSGGSFEELTDFAIKLLTDPQANWTLKAEPESDDVEIVVTLNGVRMSKTVSKRQLREALEL